MSPPGEAKGRIVLRWTSRLTLGIGLVVTAIGCALLWEYARIGESEDMGQSIRCGIRGWARWRLAFRSRWGHSSSCGYGDGQVRSDPAPGGTPRWGHATRARASRMTLMRSRATSR